MNRRQFVSASTMAALGRPLSAEPSYREEFRDMLVQFIQKKLNALNQRWDAERAQIRSAAQVRERNRFVREKFLQMIHGLPDRPPLNTRVVSVHQRQGYRIENVLFQSRPDFWMNGSLFVPNTPGKHPAVLSPCGHADEGHVYEVYQQAHFDFVKSGFVVLTYDPIGQGERRVYWNPRTGETEVGGCTYEHSMFGQMLLLMGEDMAHYRIWDGMRGIDYLLTRPEVDPARIGCAGQSGGGTLTLYLSALDRRIQCAVVSEGGTAARWPLEIRENQRFGPADAEQNLFPAAIHGIDQPDLHAAIAPTPLLVLIEQYSPRFNQAADFIRTRYRLLGIEDRFGTEEAGDPHGWTRKLRLATTNWLRRWLLGAPPIAEEPVLQPEPPENLHCAPNGSLRHSQIGDSIFSLVLKKQAGLPPPAALPAAPAELQSLLARLIHYRRLAGPLAPRPVAVTQRQGYRVEKLAFLSEPGIYVPAWIFVPDGATSKLPVTLFVSEAGKESEGLEHGRLERWARQGNLVVAIDVRGMGETRPPHVSNYNRYEYRNLMDVETALTYIAWSMDESLFGMRVQDVVRGVDFALSRAEADPASLRLHGKGQGALWAMVAAVFDERVRSVVAEGGLLSYRTLTETDRYLYSAGVFIPDILLHLDLPHVAAAIAGRPLTLVSPVDSMMQPVPLSRAEKAYRPARTAYERAGKSGSFQIVARGQR